MDGLDLVNGGRFDLRRMQKGLGWQDQQNALNTIAKRWVPPCRRQVLPRKVRGARAYELHQNQPKSLSLEGFLFHVFHVLFFFVIDL